MYLIPFYWLSAFYCKVDVVDSNGKEDFFFKKRYVTNVDYMYNAYTYKK